MNPTYHLFLKTLKETGFTGDITDDLANRSVMSTDNSVYQVMPSAVLYPKSEDDVVRIFKLSSEERFKSIVFAPRGGGTGTNGQSLTSGIVINFRKYCRNILHLDLEARTVEIESGVVLDELNHYLKPYGFFFGPTVSPSNRATLGGMASTDASGKGSCIYGKTSQHILSLTAVLANGEVLRTEKIPFNKISDSPHYQLLADVKACAQHYHPYVSAEFPVLHRYMTGYDLAHVIEADKIDLSRIIAGSEGTLATITRLTLHISPLPAYKSLFILKHASFEEALRAAQLINATSPAAVEVIDETIMRLAHGDVLFNTIKGVLLSSNEKIPASINLVEYHFQTPDALNENRERISTLFRNHVEMNTYGFSVIDKPEDMAQVWLLRKKGVEYLGKLPEVRKPVSGIEDTVVDPMVLSQYIPALKAILDKYGLTYGMFGHIDAGCIHVRPALDLTNPEDERLYHRISDEVAALVKSFGGLIWGEHGKGFRSAYIQDFFSPEIYRAFREIKTLFDPYNQLNPDKLVTPLTINQEIPRIDQPPKRANRLKKINFCDKIFYASSLQCNGNATCLESSLSRVICPSYKVTQDPVHSPKGRASILNEYLQLKSGDDEILKSEAKQLVFEAFEGCLGCKACISQCPVSVNIPSLKSTFYAAFFRKKRRPIKQYIIAYSETINLFFSHFPRISNYCLKSAMIQTMFKKWGLIDFPLFAVPALNERDTVKKHTYITKKNIDKLTPPEKSVCLLVDWLLRVYEPTVIIATIQYLEGLGYHVYLCGDATNGKSFHALGMNRIFYRIADLSAKYLKKITAKSIPIIGIEPSLTLVYQDEYPEKIDVYFLQSFITQHCNDKFFEKKVGFLYYLFVHCSEKTCVPESEKLWVKIFESYGLSLEIVSVGCCGMAGSYGHEVAHLDNSKKLFEMHWLSVIEEKKIPLDKILATGFSCRSQMMRMLGVRPCHPIEVLPFINLTAHVPS
jgi:FAD/FMN-containing dehydrogenase/Fe-S oxidoreductase